MNDRERLFKWMADRDMTVKVLAEHMGTSLQIIYMIKAGDREVSSVFKWRFKEVFGDEAANEVFCVAPVTEPA